MDAKFVQSTVKEIRLTIKKTRHLFCFKEDIQFPFTIAEKDSKKNE